MNASPSKHRSTLLRGFSLRALAPIAATALAAVVFGHAPSANAEDPNAAGKTRYSRDMKRSVSTKDNLDTKFKSAKEQSEKTDKRVQLMEGAEFAKKRAAVEQAVADKQIDFLKQLIKSTDKGDAEYPDLLFRLADHHLEKKAYFDQQAGDLFDDIYAAEDAGDKTKAKQLEAKQKELEKKTKEASAQAARVYQALVTDKAFQSYKRMDEALYYYAFELGQLGEEAKMQEAYKRLINDYPQSEFISQAYLAFADYYFGKADIQNASRLYEKVLEFKDSPVYAYALYKLAWCHLNPIGTADPRYDKSLNYFIATIKATLEGRAGSDSAGKQLRRDARRDLVRAYIFAAKPSNAKPFFEQWGVGPGNDENDYRPMMEALANQYFGNGMYTESTYIYKQLQGQFPGDASNCDWQGAIVINTLATDNKEIQWSETKKLGELWNSYKDADYSKQVKKKCRDNALDTIKQMATVWHDEAIKTKLPRTFELAEQAYGEFLQIFPKDKDAYELQYYYSELLWQLADMAYNQKDQKSQATGLAYFRKAHDEFVKVLELDPKGKWTNDAAFAQMLAMKNALEYDETGGKSKACKTNSEGVCVYKEEKKKRRKGTAEDKGDAGAEYPITDYTDDEKSMLNAYDIYAKYVTNKDDKELPKIMYHRAKLAYSHNRFDEARPLLEDMVTNFDGSVYAAWCAEMLLSMLTIEWVDVKNTPADTVKASDDLEAWAVKFQTLKSWSHPEADELREYIPIVLAGIGWKRGMAYRDAGAAYVEGQPGGDPEGFKKCGKQFVDVYNQFESHERADTLLWNAADCFDAAYQVGEAIKIRKVLLDTFPTSQHAKDTLHFLGGSYQAVAFYDDAAGYFEQFAAKYPADKRSSESLQNAYLFRLGLGQEQQAADNLKKYEDLYKKRDVKRAASIFWSKHGLLDEPSKIKAHAAEYLKIYGAKGGTDRQVVAEAVIGQIEWRDSCEKELLFDSCLSVKRTRAGNQAREIEKRKRMEAKLAKLKAQGKDKKKKEEDDKKRDIPQYCGSATQGQITLFRRDKDKAASAQRRFETALRLAAKGVELSKEEAEADPNRVEEFKDAWGMSMVYAADAKYEEYLRLKLPEGMSFNVEDWRKDSGVPAWEKKYKEQVKKRDDSIKAFSEYNEKKQKLGAELIESYARVKSTGSPYWVLAAAARSAMVNSNFADQLYRADVPEEIKTEDDYYAYCDQLATYADEAMKRALDAFRYCIERSKEFQYFNEFSRLCEQEMEQQDADTYPATNEAFGQSIYTQSRVDKVEVLTDPAGEKLNFVRRKKGVTAPTEEPAASEEPAESEEEG
jgi:TolA-binding protein